MKLFLFCFSVLMMFGSCVDQQIINTPPSSYELKQNYPNPFTDTTRVEYGVPYLGPGSKAPWLRLVVYDRMLQKQAILMEDASHGAGSFAKTWNGRGINGVKVPPGLYYIELQQASGIFTEKDVNVGVLLRIVALKQ